jgi:hypothetical protein
MKYRERSLRTAVVFLLPSLKLKEPSLNGPSIENRLHSFLMDDFGGYTAQAGNIFGYWREDKRDSWYNQPIRTQRAAVHTELNTKDISSLLRAWSGGDQSALNGLTPIVYEELRRLAHRYMERERSGQTRSARQFPQSAIRL